MGLDVFLGAVVFVAGVRGWLRGFLLQAIQIAAILSSLALAAPVRDLARPHVAPHFPTISPDLLDRLIWWSSLAICYVVVLGIGSTLARAIRRRPSSEPAEPNRSDQGAGFLLGALKGGIVASFLASALLTQAPVYLRTKSPAWFESQLNSSYALRWADQYRPADLIWHSSPVQLVIAHVKENGLLLEAEQEQTKKGKTDTAGPKSTTPADRSPEAPLRTAAKPRTMTLRPARRLDPDSPEFLSDLESEMAREGIELKSR